MKTTRSTQPASMSSVSSAVPLDAVVGRVRKLAADGLMSQQDARRIAADIAQLPASERSGLEYVLVDALKASVASGTKGAAGGVDGTVVAWHTLARAIDEDRVDELSALLAAAAPIPEAPRDAGEGALAAAQSARTVDRPTVGHLSPAEALIAGHASSGVQQAFDLVSAIAALAGPATPPADFSVLRRANPFFDKAVQQDIGIRRFVARLWNEGLIATDADGPAKPVELNYWGQSAGTLGLSPKQENVRDQVVPIWQHFPNTRATLRLGRGGYGGDMSVSDAKLIGLYRLGDLIDAGILKMNARGDDAAVGGGIQFQVNLSAFGADGQRVRIGFANGLMGHDGYASDRQGWGFGWGYEREHELTLSGKRAVYPIFDNGRELRFSGDVLVDARPAMQRTAVAPTVQDSAPVARRPRSTGDDGALREALKHFLVEPDDDRRNALLAQVNRADRRSLAVLRQRLTTVLEGGTDAAHGPTTEEVEEIVAVAERRAKALDARFEKIMQAQDAQEAEERAAREAEWLKGAADRAAAAQRDASAPIPQVAQAKSEARQHFDWCVERAMYHANLGEFDAAVASFISDVTKHSGTTWIVDGGRFMMTFAILKSSTQDAATFKKALEGFL